MVGTKEEYQGLIAHAEALEQIATTVKQVHVKQRLEALSGNIKELARSMEINNG